MSARALTLAVAASCAALAATLVPVAAQEPAVDGKALYQSQCATCHSAGERMPGTLALAVKYGSARSPVLDAEPVAAALVKLAVRRGVNAMPSFRKTEISDAELEAIAVYLAR
jgi:mono/diheme cytochrome c family protein